MLSRYYRGRYINEVSYDGPDQRLQQVKQSARDLRQAQRNLHLYGLDHLADVVGRSITLHDEEIVTTETSQLQDYLTNSATE